MTNATITEKTESRTAVRVEMLNTAMEKEIYVAVFLPCGTIAVNVQRTNAKTGKVSWGLLNERTHRDRFAKVLKVAKEAL